MGRKLTKEEAQEKLNAVRPKVEIISDYNGMYSYITCRCRTCDYVWSTKLHTLIYSVSVGCPRCAIEVRNKNEMISHDNFVARVKKKNSNIKIIGKYTGMKHRIDVECSICGNQWAPIADSIANCNTGCPVCGRDKVSEKKRMSHNDFVNRCKLADVTPIEEYTGLRNKILVRCNKCGEEYMAPPASLLAGHGCPLCRQSKGERIISLCLNENNIKFIPQYMFDICRDKNPLPFDFYLPEDNVCIEYDGEQHFRAVNYFGGEEGLAIRQKHDDMKTKFCNNNKIKLIRIRYDSINTITDVEDILLDNNIITK